MENGLTLFVNIHQTNPGISSNWNVDSNTGCLAFLAGTVLDHSDIVKEDGSNTPQFPKGYGTLEFTFDRVVLLATLA
jgi:hypothetical protein